MISLILCDLPCGLSPYTSVLQSIARFALGCSIKEGRQYGNVFTEEVHEVHQAWRRKGQQELRVASRVSMTSQITQIDITAAGWWVP
jgi:hypothetical protein